VSAATRTALTAVRVTKATRSCIWLPDSTAVAFTAGRSVYLFDIKHPSPVVESHRIGRQPGQAKATEQVNDHSYQWIANPRTSNRSWCRLLGLCPTDPGELGLRPVRIPG
jgi:hypothetical protein